MQVKLRSKMSITEIVTSYRAKLLAYEQDAEHSIREAHSHMLAMVQPHISALLKEIEDSKSSELHWLYVNNRLPTIKALAKRSMNTFASQAKAVVIQAQHKGATLGIQSAQAQLGHMAPDQTANHPGHQALKPVDNLMDGFGDEASEKVGKALIAGVSIGQQPDTISRAIMAALLICLFRSLTIARTEEMAAYRDAWQLTMKQNNVGEWERSMRE
jgi:hypothetical protein